MGPKLFARCIVPALAAATRGSCAQGMTPHRTVSSGTAFDGVQSRCAEYYVKQTSPIEPLAAWLWPGRRKSWKNSLK